MPSNQETTEPPIKWILGVGIILLLSILTLWTWQKWDRVWIERSEQFFPLEWQNEDLETLAWRYPVYRSNDTYQWVRVADELHLGNKGSLLHNHNEGPLEGRPHAWHSGLAQLLRATGSLTAMIQDWPTERGIHSSAHWFGPVLLIFTTAIGFILVSKLSNAWAAAFFSTLYFFNASIQWDFAFSRLDHESLFQLSLLLQVFGLCGLLQHSTQTTRWAILAGVGTALCWWISSTMQIVISVFSMLGCIWTLLTSRIRSNENSLARSFMTWGAVSAFGILLACIFDSRGPTTITLSALHPLYALTQLGACSVCAALALNNHRKRLGLLILGLLLGMTPLLWIGIFQEASHTWFDPLVRRVHHYIVEFQSPFKNGVWQQAILLHSLLVAACFAYTQAWKRPNGRFLIILCSALFALSILQTRWLGLFATVATIGFALNLSKQRFGRYIAFSAALIFLLTWAIQWNRIETKPGKIFVTDLFLQVGARDINLNLQRLSKGTTSHVAIPYAFSASSALYPEVHPLGTLYWENRDGIALSAELFAAENDSHALRVIQDQSIDYLAVQSHQLGRPFVDMTTWTAFGSDSLLKRDNSLAWRLSTGDDLPTWCEELPFYGTFDPKRFSMRIYRITAD